MDEITLWDRALVGAVVGMIAATSIVSLVTLSRMRKAQGADEAEDSSEPEAEEAAAVEVSLLPTLIVLSLLFGITLLVWAISGRPWAELGFRWGEGGWMLGEIPAGWYAGLAVSVAAALYLVSEPLRTARSSDKADKAAKEMEGIAYLVPRSGPALWMAFAVSVMAGLAEELFYRGFLFWFLAALAPALSPSLAPEWAAMLFALTISTLFFGLSHGYQGLKGILRTGAVGLLLGVLYWMSGSLILAMALHALIDVTSFATAYIIRNHPRLTGGNR